MPNSPSQSTNSAPAAATRERILDSAASVLAERGYHATSIDEVAGRSGVSKGGFYFHFPSKEAMTVALVESLSDKLVRRVERAMGAEPQPDLRLAIAMHALVRTFARQRTLATVVLVNVVGQGKSLDKRLIPLRERFAGLIQRELEGAVRAGVIAPLDTGLASRVWLGALHEVLLHWLTNAGAPPVERVVDDLGAMLFRGVGIPAERFALAGGVDGA
ncbi:MAG: TetR/AcrR family transcriptional regulator [SAR202 cluster bacterium]|nr:TetR/AcrR family transcriptional regulator [SAR202 cluster bacterium]